MSISTLLRDRLPTLYRRKLHLYCIGAAKTGTTSVASMFTPSFRSAHEQDIETFNSQLIRYLEGQIDVAEMENFILERDSKLNLDVESSHPMGYIGNILSSQFPEAKFIITIREPYSWLRSRLNFHYRVDPPEWQEYRHYFWTSRQTEYNDEELTLQRYGLCSLDVYLSQYADHYRTVLNTIPEDRRLIVRTHELASSTGKIARFAGIDQILIMPSHSNREDDKIRPLDELDDTYVRSIIWKHCEPLVTKYFPEKAGDYERVRYRRNVSGIMASSNNAAPGVKP